LFTESAARLSVALNGLNGQWQENGVSFQKIVNPRPRAEPQQTPNLARRQLAGSHTLHGKNFQGRP